MSIRNDQVQRDPAGRAVVGGKGVECCALTTGVAAGTERQTSAGSAGDGSVSVSLPVAAS